MIPANNFFFWFLMGFKKNILLPSMKGKGAFSCEGLKANARVYSRIRLLYTAIVKLPLRRCSEQILFCFMCDKARLMIVDFHS